MVRGGVSEEIGVTEVQRQKSGRYERGGVPETGTTKETDFSIGGEWGWKRSRG